MNTKTTISVSRIFIGNIIVGWSSLVHWTYATNLRLNQKKRPEWINTFWGLFLKGQMSSLVSFSWIWWVKSPAGLIHHFGHDLVEYRWESPIIKCSIKLLYVSNAIKAGVEWENMKKKRERGIRRQRKSLRMLFLFWDTWIYFTSLPCWN